MILKSWLRAITFATLLVSLVGAQRQQMVVYKFPWGQDQVTFNPDRVNIRQLNLWMQLSPRLSDFNGLGVPPALETCIAEDSRYRRCGQNVLDEANARVTLGTIASTLHKLQTDEYPPALRPLVQYAIALQSFALDAGSHRLSFILNNDTSYLEEKAGDVNPALNCRLILDRIRASSDPKERQQLARFDWFNCAWQAEVAKVGPYPTKAWESFLAEYGISEKIVEESPD